MELRDFHLAELRRRTALLPEELELWQELTDQNQEGMGIHQSQVDAINFMFDELVGFHEELLDELAASSNDSEFSERRSELEGELGGAHGLLAIFRYIFSQRLDDGRFRDVLDVADLVGAACYRPCIGLAQDWEVLGEDEYREPPLTLLNARSSPAAITRRHTFGGFGFDLESYEEMALPVSVITLRFLDTVALWSFCSIYHETGHLLDQDLRLSQEMEPLLADALADTADDTRLTLWRYWIRELIADAFGVLLGGTGFALGLGDMLLLPPSEVTAIQPGDKHPAPYLRMFLVGALLRQLDTPELAEAAAAVEETWQELYGTPTAELAPFVDDCPLVAEVLLHEPLAEQLRNHSLRDFAQDPAEDERLARELAAYLADGGNGPDPATFPIRLVPAGTRLAVQRIAADHDDALASIQELALDFVASMERPEFMVAPDLIQPEREAHLRRLARGLRFS